MLHNAIASYKIVQSSSSVCREINCHISIIGESLWETTALKLHHFRTGLVSLNCFKYSQRASTIGDRNHILRDGIGIFCALLHFPCCLYWLPSGRDMRQLQELSLALYYQSFSHNLLFYFLTRMRYLEKTDIQNFIIKFGINFFFYLIL
jgi:hypothetical protein